jgi:hypothetical protein
LGLALPCADPDPFRGLHSTGRSLPTKTKVIKLMETTRTIITRKTALKQRLAELDRQSVTINRILFPPKRNFFWWGIKSLLLDIFNPKESERQAEHFCDLSGQEMSIRNEAIKIAEELDPGVKEINEQNRRLFESVSSDDDWLTVS